MGLGANAVRPSRRALRALLRMTGVFEAIDQMPLKLGESFDAIRKLPVILRRPRSGRLALRDAAARRRLLRRRTVINAANNSLSAPSLSINWGGEGRGEVGDSRVVVD